VSRQARAFAAASACGRYPPAGPAVRPELAERQFPPRHQAPHRSTAFPRATRRA